MKKMSLLLVVLSVCALHAADEKEEALPMEHISDIYQLAEYCSKVVAYTSSINANDSTSLRYGIVVLDVREEGHIILHKPYCKKKVAPIKLYAFEGGSLIEQPIRNPLRPVFASVEFFEKLPDYIEELLFTTWSEQSKNDYKEIIEAAKIKIRLANKEERKDLMKAILDGKIKCDNLPESNVLSCLAKD